jgi:hypothetical protein
MQPIHQETPMNAKPSPILKVVTALAVCAFARSVSAENTMGSSRSEVAPPAANPPKDTGAPDAKDEDSSRPPEHLRIGVLGGVGFPRPLAIEGLIKIERTIALGAEYSLLPGMTVSGVDISFWAIAADLRIFPFTNGFFVGVRAGYQRLGGQGSLMVTGYGTVREALTINTTFLNPRLGFLWTWDPGITLGIDAGAQFPVAAKASSTLPPGNAATDEVMSVASSFGKSVLPTVDLLRIGILL